MKNACLQCGTIFTWEKPTVVAWIGDKLFSFCSTNCRHAFLYPNLSNPICVREGCYRRVPKANRMLCAVCYQTGNSIGEPNICVDLEERARWNKAEQSVLKRLEGQVRVYSAQNMTQQELSSLVPSQNKK
jgi:hypothetical protein